MSFFRSFAPLRDYNADIRTMGEEIAAALRRRGIALYGPAGEKPPPQMS